MGQSSADQSSVDATLIGNVPLFVELKAQDREKLAAIAQRVTIKAGERVFQEGATSTHFYIVLDGRVSLSVRPDTREEATLLTLGPDEVLGWSALFRGQRVATGTTLSETTLLAFKADELRQLCEDDHDVGYAVMKATCDELARRLCDTRLQLIDVFHGPPRSEREPVPSEGR